MSPSEIHHLAAPYALNALTRAEHEAVEAHYEYCDVCAADIRAYGQITATLAVICDATPPAALRSHVLDQVAATRQVPQRPGWWPRWARLAHTDGR